MSNIKVRLEALEKQLCPDASVTLFFADGTSTTLSMAGKRDRLWQMVYGITTGAPGWEKERDLIARSIGSEESGGGHLIDIARVFLHGPPEPSEEEQKRLDASE